MFKVRANMETWSSGKIHGLLNSVQKECWDLPNEIDTHFWDATDNYHRSELG